MKTMTIVHGDHVFRWAGGTFMPAWKVHRAEEHVPDDMIALPESLNRSRITHEDITRIARAYRPATS